MSFAVAEPERLLRQLCTKGEATEEPLRHYDQIPPEESCFAMLGLSPSATVEEVKEAYRERVKQNHPDRVQGMSTIFTALAEAETKKLNAAYEQALVRLQVA